MNRTSCLLLLLVLALPAGAQVRALEEALATARSDLHNGALGAAIHRLETFPDGAERWELQFWLGTAYLLDGRLEHAGETLDEALALQPDFPALWVQRAIVEQERSRPEVALQFLEVAAQLDSGYALTYLNAGLAWQSLGEVEKARGAFGRFLKLSAAASGSSRMRRLRRDVLKRIADRGGEHAGIGRSPGG